MYPVIISLLFPLQVLSAICENHLSPLVSLESWRIFTNLQQTIYIYIFFLNFFLLPSAFISFFLRTIQFNPHPVILDSLQREFCIVVMVWVKLIFLSDLQKLLMTTWNGKLRIQSMKLGYSLVKSGRKKRHLLYTNLW